MIDEECGKIVGFCQLSAYNPFSSFAQTACVTYFIASDYTACGLGGKCLKVLEKDARKQGIQHLLAEISSENAESISFHKKHGFTVCGELKDIGEKLGSKFGVVLMQKDIA